MRFRCCELVSIALVSLVGISSAHAQDANAVMCNSNNPSDIIAGCTAVINSGRESPGHLAMAYTYRGTAYSGQGADDKAVADFSQAISLAPNDPIAYFDRGVSYAGLGKLDLSIADFTSAIALKPDYGRAYLDRARVRKAQGDAAGAQADFAKASSLGAQ